MKKTTKLKNILRGDSLSFLMEAHNALSARIVEGSNFEGIWASGLCISASLGVRDSNEASWTQVLEILEFMSDATTIPILLDGDTGYGNFNSMRRLVRKLEQRDIAGVCIEDKLFPKTNSFIRGDCQPLASIDEFAGKIKAAKDTQSDEDFCVIARTEALIAGWGMEEALRRAEAYIEAGANGILIHSKINSAQEVLAFKKAWGNRSPVVIIPTKYYRTPTEVFEKAGFRVVIWANHLMRSAIQAMERTARRIYLDKSLLNVEDDIATLSEVFRLQCADELREAEKKYLGSPQEKVTALILAASRGEELGLLTEEKPKALIQIGDKPLLHRMVSVLNEIGIKNITVVRGYKKEAIDLPNIRYVDNDEYESSQELYSLNMGLREIQGTALVSYGDILFKKYIPMTLLESEGDLSIVVDSDWQRSQQKGRYTDFVSCDVSYRREEFDQKVTLLKMDSDLAVEEINGEWIGLLKLSEKGLALLRDLLLELAGSEGFRQMRLSRLFNELIARGHRINVSYIKGHWLDIDSLQDFYQVGDF